MIPTVNFHLTKMCNFKCKFCYATFNDILTKEVSKEEQFKIIKMLAESKRFKKINFAGGEPTLIPHIHELIEYSKLLGFETSIVTNASKIDFKWVQKIAKSLDILTLSLDSLRKETNVISGRNQRQDTVKEAQLIEIATACHTFGINLKVNTVVSQFNQNEILAGFINKIRPFRWKILQVTKVEGQNDVDFDLVKINSDAFVNYCTKNKITLLPDVKVVEESDNLIQGSYLMLDQLGRFFDSSKQRHRYSDGVLDVGVEDALNQVEVDVLKFKEREGNYTIIKNKENAYFKNNSRLSA